MRHRMRGRRLGRTSSHRTAMGRNLISSLFLHGRICTTEPKAKEYRARAERLITLAKTDTVARRRRAVAALQDQAAVARLFGEIGPAFAVRPGGYTRIVKLSRRRLGDQGSQVYLELLTHVPKPKGAGKAAKGEAAGEPEGEAPAARGAGRPRGKRGAPEKDAEE